MSDRVAHDPSFPDVRGWTPPTALERKAILDATTSIAIVGASSNPARASNFVATYLFAIPEEFDVYLVNPRETEILGHPVYPSLDALPVVPDMVDVFRRNDDLAGVAREAIAVGSKSFWVQLGLWSVEAAEICLDAELTLVMNRCTKIEHARFAGGLHLAGFNTGVISSRRHL